MAGIPKRNILERWGITVDELTTAVEENGSLRGMLLGYVAEIKLREIIHGSQLVTTSQKDDDHNRGRKGDRRVHYRGHEFTIESKSLQTNSVKRRSDGTFTGRSQCDASDRRTVRFNDGSTLETTCLLVGEFDVLSVNLFAFEEQWRFVFARNEDLPRSTFRNYTTEQRLELLASLVPVTWPPQPPFTDDLFGLLDRLVEVRSRSIPAF